MFSRGLAVVELAICLPILFLILFATIEACSMLQLKQNVQITAYEGARIGILPGSNAALVQTQCEMLLDDRGILGYTIAMTPDPSVLNIGDLLTVTVTADCAANAVAGGVFFEGKSISESIVMRAE
jgi:hypothetical protein